MPSLKRYIARRHRFLAGLAGGLCLVVLAVVFSPSLTSPIDSYAACAEAGYPVTESEPPICREGLRAFRGTPGPKATAAPPVANVAFELLVDGDTRTAVPEQEQVFIDTPAAWAAYWRQVHSGQASMPPLLPVNFAASSVVGLSLGQRTTSGYGLKVTGVTQTAHGATVSLTETTPTITCAVPNQISNHYVIIRTAKLTPPVSFRVTPERRRC